MSGTAQRRPPPTARGGQLDNKTLAAVTLGAAALVGAAVLAVVMMIVAFMLGRYSMRKKLITPVDPRIIALTPVMNFSTFDDIRQTIDSNIAVAQEEDFGSGELSAACKDALAGGKRLRAVIATLAGKGGSPVTEIALAVEYLHNASLIIDDMPEFDNDTVRRGAQTIHAKYGKRTALLAAFALVSAAVRNIGRQISACTKMPDADIRAATIISLLGTTMGGTQGAAQGQHMDMMTSHEVTKMLSTMAVDKDFHEELCRMKTGSFFRMALVGGWVASGKPINRKTMATLDQTADNIGIGFQIADDIGDHLIDTIAQKWNVCVAWGKDTATAALKKCTDESAALIDTLGIQSPAWTDIYAAYQKMTLPSV